ncbi:MAG: SpaA isopeptide-forming pilin-related protein [Bacilli bacterium]|nr:SpaA isopeptide-forming pilin-related protein [Bacilli bacterium]
MKKYNIRKSILALFITIISILGLSNVNAASSAPSSLKMKYRNYTPPISFPQTFHIKETTDGKYVYCATYAKNMPVTSVNYTNAGSYTDPGVNYILEQGYKAKTDKEYFVAQTAYWIYLMDTKKMNYSDSINTFKSKISSSSNTYAKQIKDLVSKAKAQKSYNQAAPTISITTDSINFTISNDGKYYVSNGIVVNSSESDYKVELVNAPKNTDFTKNGNKITIKVPASSVSNTKSTFTVKVSNSKTILKSYKYTPSNSKYQVMSATYPIAKSASASKSMSLAVDKVVISKQDVTSKKELPGAKLEIRNASNEVIDSWTSSDTPHEVSLTPGTYKLKETIAPEGYDLSTEEISFEVTNKGTTNKVVMYNTPTKKEVKKTTISKQDATTKQELPGATLVLEDENGNEIDKWVSGSTPHVITDLKPGKYKLTETIAPEGYELSTESVTFEVDENGETSPVVMYNSPKKVVAPQVIINKQDSSTKEQIAGATLEVRNEKGEVVETFVTETTAHVIKNLAPGTYTITETDAPEGYKLSTEKVSFTVPENNETNINVIVYNTKEVVPQKAEEVAVPSTGSFSTIASSMIGLIVLMMGSVLIAKNFKKNNGI